MAYNELIKSFAKIRGYMREFYVYGFRHRLDIDAKSARSYDNERRRVESWLGEYMHFGQDEEGKRTYLSVDSRAIPHNPLYKAFKTKSFTDNDVMLHFYLMDLLSEEEGLTMNEIIDELEEEYFCDFDVNVLDESTIRKKLKEYEQLGLVEKKRQGRESIYRKVPDGVNLNSWRDTVSFYSEAAPLGVIGSYLLDKYENSSEFFRFKHHHLMKALDSEILYTLLDAIMRHAELKLTMLKAKKSIPVIPFRIYVSTQYGRQYLLAWNMNVKQFRFYRLDCILYVSTGGENKNWNDLYDQMQELASHIWGAALSEEKRDHIEFTLRIEPYAGYVAQRLEREKRCGIVEQINEDTWKFSADVCDALEMLPWIRTFTGRIRSLSCSNPEVETRLWKDMEAMYALYGIDGADCGKSGDADVGESETADEKGEIGDVIS